MNDTEERRDWLAELVYRELDIIRDYVGILRFEDHRRAEMLARAQNVFCCERAKPVLGAVGPRDSHSHPSSISAGVGEEQKTSQITTIYGPGEPGPTDVCNLRQGDVTQEMPAAASPSEVPGCVESGCCVIPGLAEPESGELAEAEASPSEVPVCVESGCCVIPGLAEPESGELAEAAASPSEVPVCVESGCCVIPGLAEPESGELEEAEASPSEVPNCVESGCCVIPGLAEPESGELAEAEASPSEVPNCVESGCCVTPGLAEPESGELAEAEASPSEVPVCVESGCCVIPGLAEPESGELAEAEASPSEVPVCVESGVSQFTKISKEGRDEDSPLPELLLAGEEQDQEESIAQDSPMSIRAVSSGNGVRGTPKAQRVTRAVVPETPSGRQQGQRITPQRNKTLVSPRAVPTISPRWRGPPLCNVTGTGALREVGWNLELKEKQGGKHLSNTLWGPLVIGVT
ncbi:retinitis pigmentosa 1-like 1 protein [Xenopus tropicalis]|uniref:Retinitis pigmentosa 1-like 1 protein n=1 Tax=Xenopus tropicalis TaxID=8364 RepID=A0A8J1JLQ7_XENTR|nr:retinitis pigmentosa 1-like 1 protein [Xenopus tropicalis]